MAADQFFQDAFLLNPSPSLIFSAGRKEWMVNRAFEQWLGETPLSLWLAGQQLQPPDFPPVVICPAASSRQLWRLQAQPLAGGEQWLLTLSPQASAAVENHPEFFQSLLANLPDTIYFKDTACRFTHINQAQAETLGAASPEEAISKTDFDFFPRQQAELAYQDDLRVLQGHAIVNQEELIHLPNGQLRWVSATKLPIRDETGQVTGLMGLSRDVTTQHRAAEELTRAKAAAEAASEAKANFLANMSHEIRTPMNAVIGLSDLLMQTSLDDEQQDMLRMLRVSGDSLMGIINDILDFSKIEAKEMVLEAIPFSLRTLVEDVIDILSPKAAECQIELIENVDLAVPEKILGDPNRLRQILLNLAANAVKFTEWGEVELAVRLQQPIKDDQANLLIHVRDTGIGIPVSKLARMFDPFAQADASITRRFGGTGLGLAISHRLVQLMKGRIWVESEEGKGTDFFITLPLTVLPSHETSVPLSWRGKQVWLIEPNHTRRLVLNQQLTGWGLWVERFDRWEALPSGTPPDLILADSLLPLPEEEPLAPVILKVMPKLPPQELGWTPFARILSPLRRQRLAEVLQQLWPQEAAYQHSSQTEAEPQPAFLPRILLAEDNLINQKVTERMFKTLGFECDVADNGEEALKMVEDYGYDLIFMDMQMPVMDGLRATREIRKLPQGQTRMGQRTGPVIIAMTANASPEDRASCQAVGMDDFLPKPVHLRDLKAALDRWTSVTA